MLALESEHDIKQLGGAPILTCLSNMKAYFASVTVLKNQTLVL